MSHASFLFLLRFFQKKIRPTLLNIIGHDSQQILTLTFKKRHHLGLKERHPNKCLTFFGKKKMLWFSIRSTLANPKTQTLITIQLHHHDVAQLIIDGAIINCTYYYSFRGWVGFQSKTLCLNQHCM